MIKKRGSLEKIRMFYGYCNVDGKIPNLIIYNCR